MRLVSNGQDLNKVGGLRVRRLMFKHGNGHVKAGMCIPGLGDQQKFLIDSKIPFPVTVTTSSVPVYTHADPETDKGVLSPTIDVNSLDDLLRLQLKRYVVLRFRGLLG